MAEHERLISTIPERCRTCFSCVRECPVKAIQITGGQAEVIPDRCVGCGKCYSVCGRDAKCILDLVEPVRTLLREEQSVIAIVAPSFPAEFPELEPGQLAQGLRTLGFSHVHEVAFGADLVARAYRELVEKDPTKRWIATSCPTLVRFVESYRPNLIPYLAPLVSPMVAEARVVHKIYGDDVKIVFVGPCVAKKNESADRTLDGDVEVALTYRELRKFFEEESIDPTTLEPGSWDPPRGGLGALFPVTGGILQAGGMSEDLIDGRIVTVDGNPDFMSAVAAFEEDDTDVHLLEVLCCDGCIGGAGMTVDSDNFTRRNAISRAVRKMEAEISKEEWAVSMEEFADLNLLRGYTNRLVESVVPASEEIEKILQKLGKFTEEDHLNCGACGYATCREHAVAIAQGMAETEMCLPYNIDALHQTVLQVQDSEAKHRALFENAVEGIFQTTVDGRFMSANPACAKLLGYDSPEQLMEQVTNLGEQHYVNPDHRKEIFEALTGGEAIEGFETEYLKRDGSHIWVSLYVRPIFSEDGVFHHCEGMMLDSTDRVEAESELRAHQEHLEQVVEARTASLSDSNTALQQSIESLKMAQTQLVQSEKMASLGGLVAGVAHEINTPVGNAVTAVSHLVHNVQEIAGAFQRGEMKKSTFTEFLGTCVEASGMIETNLHRAAELVQSFKRVAVDQTAEDRRAFSLCVAINDVLLSLRPHLKRTSIEVKLECPPEPIELDSYPGAFSQIITNLIVNSLTHAYDKDSVGEIKIICTVPDEKNVKIVYSDDGKGMSEDVLSKIFDPFYTTARSTGGTGLGMHILYNLITQQLSGHVEVESTPGAGTTFTMTFPRERA